MGWYFGSSSRAAVIAECTANNEHNETLRKYCSGNTLWTVQRSHCTDGTWQTFIGCYLMQRAGRNDWGYKPMDESMGPTEASCPLAFLALVPDPGGYATEWRKRVRDYHAMRAPVLARRRAARRIIRETVARVRFSYSLANPVHVAQLVECARCGQRFPASSGPCGCGYRDEVRS